jgi:hypothetical protein
MPNALPPESQATMLLRPGTMMLHIQALTISEINLEHSDSCIKEKNKNFQVFQFILDLFGRYGYFLQTQVNTHDP